MLNIYVARQSEHMRFMVKVTMTHGDTVLDPLCVKQEPISQKFLCVAHLTWWTEDVFGQGRIFLTVFH